MTLLNTDLAPNVLEHAVFPVFSRHLQKFHDISLILFLLLLDCTSWDHDIVKCPWSNFFFHLRHFKIDKFTLHFQLLQVFAVVTLYDCWSFYRPLLWFSLSNQPGPDVDSDNNCWTKWPSTYTFISTLARYDITWVKFDNEGKSS